MKLDDYEPIQLTTVQCLELHFTDGDLAAHIGVGFGTTGAATRVNALLADEAIREKWTALLECIEHRYIELTLGLNRLPDDEVEQL